MRSTGKKILKKVFYVFYLIIVVALVLEIILRIYNPFPTGIKGDKIVLRINTRYEVENNDIPVLEKRIIHSKNSMGFRGPEMPADKENWVRVFTVGGSTTECTYLNDGKTWTDQLQRKIDSSLNNVWFNNAGLAGHSTFGHIILMNDYLIKLKPSMILMMAGVNDMGRNDLTASDKYSMKGTYGSVASFFTKNSELINLIANLMRAKRAKTNRLNDTWFDLRNYEKMSIPEAEMEERLKAHRSKYLSGYEQRMDSIVKICNLQNIGLVLITQPALFGKGIDSVSGADLEQYKLFNDANGMMWWKTLELYNEVTRQIAVKNNILLIDLANELPKSSRYFYDMIHFTDEGALKVSEIIDKQLSGYLLKLYPSHKN